MNLPPLSRLLSLSALLASVACPNFAYTQDHFPIAPGTGLLPEDAAAAMTLPPGFKSTLFAGEPDVHQPITFTIDERGRLWVVENYAYPDWSPYGRDRIIILEDTDGDGQFNTQKVFYDQLNFASGIAVGFGGVWIGTAPYLLFIPDKNRDDIPDGPPQVVLDGWGHQDLHETLNSFVWGPDGWLYGNQGVFTHSNVGKPGARDEDRTPLNACVWRYHPTKKVFEVFAEGMSNQWGLDFNDYGDAFVTACVIPHLYHVVQGGHYIRQAGQHFNPYTYGDIQTIADHLHYDKGVEWHEARFGQGGTDALGGGHAHAGTLVYLGDNFPEEYRGALFTHNILGNRINQEKLVPSGSGYIGKHSPDFMLANDGWFRGLRLETGPDGSLFNSDWYDARACHQQRPHDRTNGRIYKISYGDPEHVDIDLATLSSTELVEMQLHPNEWHVRRSRLILQERGPDPEVHEALAKLIRNTPETPKKLRALWALHATLGLSEARALEYLKSDDPYLRGWTVQLSCEDKNPTSGILKAIEEMAQDDPSPITRRFIASAAKRIPLEQRWPTVEALFTHGEDADDHNLPLLYWFAAEPLVAQDPERAQKLAESTPLASIRPFFIRRQADAAMASNEGASDSQESGLESLLKSLITTNNPELQLEILETISKATEGQTDLSQPKNWRAAYEKVSKSPNPVVIQRADELAARFGDRNVYWMKRSIVMDTFAPLPARQAALEIMLEGRDFQRAPMFQELLSEPGLRMGALRGLAPYSVPGTPEAIFNVYDSFSPEERKLALTILAQRDNYAHVLARAISDGIVPVGDLDASLARQLRMYDDPDINGVLAEKWGVAHQSSQAVTDEMEKWRRLLTPQRLANADPANGREVYAQTCASCHVLFEQGIDLGPELTGSNRKELDYILANVIDPNSTIGRDYLLTILKTKDGRSAAGIVKRDTPSSITLASPAETQVYARSNVDSIEKMEVSLMPPALFSSLSEDDVADLVAYLQLDGPLPE